MNAVITLVKVATTIVAGKQLELDEQWQCIMVQWCASTNSGALLVTSCHIEHLPHFGVMYRLVDQGRDQSNC